MGGGRGGIGQASPLINAIIGPRGWVGHILTCSCLRHGAASSSSPLCRMTEPMSQGGDTFKVTRRAAPDAVPLCSLSAPCPAVSAPSDAVPLCSSKYAHTATSSSCGADCAELYVWHSPELQSNCRAFMWHHRGSISGCPLPATQTHLPA